MIASLTRLGDDLILSWRVKERRIGFPGLDVYQIVSWKNRGQRH
jgi:hypothetical protein